jgi:alkylated DNA nucleotide flippase Atl1
MNDFIRAVGRIPPGRWVTFGELAELAGHPGAARSAGRITHAHEDGYKTPTWRLFKARGEVPNVSDEVWGEKVWHRDFEQRRKEEGLVQLINGRYRAT